MQRFEAVHRSERTGVDHGKLLDSIGRLRYQWIIGGL